MIIRERNDPKNSLKYNENNRKTFEKKKMKLIGN